MQISTAKENTQNRVRATGKWNEDGPSTFSYCCNVLEGSLLNGQRVRVLSARTAQLLLAPSAYSPARGQDLPVIDSLLPPFINIRPSNMAVWKSASPLRRKALRVLPDT